MSAFPPVEQITGSHAAVYEAYWNQADAKKGGVLGAIDAAAYLKKSGLSEKVLSQVWDLSDPSGKGYLDKTGFTVALKLIALAQSRQDFNTASLAKDTPPPNLGPIEMQLAASVTGDWAIPASELVKYDQIFTGLQPISGKLSGDKVKPVLLNSKLPVEVLGRVWDLSDVDKDGMLDKEEFALAMHLVYRALEKEPVPAVLPPALIPPSKRGPAGAAPHGFDLSVPPSPAGAVKALPWVVAPAEKSKFDDMFKNADNDKDGFVDGLEIKDIFLQSGLPQNVLANIWNLCDSKAMGKLNAEQFALAMHLIQQKLKGVDPPDSLTPEMVPPSMRTATGGPVDMVTDFNTQGMQELDMIQKQIDDIKRQKLQYEQEKAQKMADIKIRNGEVQGLQKELDVINGTVTKLENQKGEAQKKLDELDDRKSKTDSDVKDMQEKCEEEEKEIARLKELITRSQSTVKDQEEQLRVMRDELNALRRTELELEQRVEAGRTQLNELLNNISQTHGKITQVQNGMTLNGLTNGGMSGRTSADPFGAEDPFKNDDPFKNSDPFKSSDPFGSEDPFGNAFGGKADAGVKANSDAFGDLDILASSKPKGDPFGSADPFGGAFSSNQLTTGQDPFAPFGGASDLTSPVNPSDPFGSDPFNPGGKSKAPPPRPSKSPVTGQRAKSPAPPIPSLPPKQKKAPAPPRPPAPKPGAKSPAHGASPMPADDPFGGFDPFASSAPAGSRAKSQSADIFSGGAFADFASFGSSGGGGLATDQWSSGRGFGSSGGGLDMTTTAATTTTATTTQWGERESEAEQWKRLKEKQEQEQADYELALKLQQQESSA